jgi:recombination protein RecA
MTKDKKKEPKKDIVLENLKGFVRLGASSEISGNVPTGHFDLDFVIHHGTLPSNVDLSTLKDYDPSKSLGLPLGKLVEIFGEEGGGKSSLAYRIVGYAQKMGFKCAWIDTEHSFSDSLSYINGARKEDIYYANMSNSENVDTVFFAEDVFDAIVNLIKSEVKVIVLDSVANLVPQARFEKEAGQATVGIVAKLMSENLGKIVNYAAKYGALVIFINQLREKIGVFFGSPETTPGGRSLKHNASVRLQVSKKNSKEADIFREDEGGKQVLIGRKARINVKKNRFAKPFFEGIEVPIYYEPYFPDIEEMMFDTGRQLKIISVYKGVFKWEGVEEEGRKSFVKKLKEEKLQNKLFFDLQKQALEDGLFLAPELSQWAEENYNPEDIQEAAKQIDEGVNNEKPTDEGQTE